MAIVWHVDLPTAPQRNDWDEPPRSNAAIETQMDTGPPKGRNRVSKALKLFKCTYFMTSSQRATFITFYHTTLANGVSEFEWTHPIDSDTRYVNFKKNNPPYSIKARGGTHYMIEFVLQELR